MKLVVTVTPERVEDIPCGALRMNADHRSIAAEVPRDEGERCLYTLLVVVWTRVRSLES
jgi:hypothetical protein